MRGAPQYTIGGAVGEVVDLHWPTQADEREALARDGCPRLLIVEPGHEPPASWDRLEDWVRPDADVVERYVRRERLRRRAAARAPVSIDDDGLLHRGPLWVALPPGELVAVATLLHAAGSMVPRHQLAEAINRPDPTGTSRSVDNVVRRVRRRVAPLGLAICAVRGAGYLLELGELPL